MQVMWNVKCCIILIIIGTIKFVTEKQNNIRKYSHYQQSTQ
jgi:hypothetical protein